MAEVRCGGVGLVCRQKRQCWCLGWKGPGHGMAEQGFGLQNLTNSLFSSFVKQAYWEVGVKGLEGSDGATSQGGQEETLTISMPFFFMRRQDLRYVRMRLRARSWNSGNCRLQDSMMAWIFSLGCLEMGTMRSRFSSTKSRTNIWGDTGYGRALALP